MMTMMIMNRPNIENQGCYSRITMLALRLTRGCRLPKRTHEGGLEGELVAVDALAFAAVVEANEREVDASPSDQACMYGRAESARLPRKTFSTVSLDSPVMDDKFDK